MRDDRQRLLDILEMAAKIEKYTARGHAAFEQDELVQIWIVYHLEVIGEAARALSKRLRKAHPEVPWADIISMRNALAHEYFGIDIKEVWDTVRKDLPALKEMIASVLREIEGTGP